MNVGHGDANVALGVECALPFAQGIGRDRDRDRARARKFGGRRLSRLVVGTIAAIVAAAGLWQLGQGVYIHAKAIAAQVLIERAWIRTLHGETHVAPWPWADTWPVARLEAPKQGIDLFVLAGASGRTIAFGPGQMSGTARPGESGNSVIGGHRDTHLAFLRDVRDGDEFVVQRENGETRRYRVVSTEVLDKSDMWVARDTGDTRLTLITCYPFDALRAGGRLRYVVTAIAA